MAAAAVTIFDVGGHGCFGVPRGVSGHEIPLGVDRVQGCCEWIHIGKWLTGAPLPFIAPPPLMLHPETHLFVLGGQPQDNWAASTLVISQCGRAG